MKRNFINMLAERWKTQTAVCVGLDSELAKLPRSLDGSNTRRLISFNKAIIDVTYDLVCAYKLQIAYYEEQGSQGIDAMIKTVDYIRKNYPSIPIILDAKRADIGNTSHAYTKAIFDVYGFDAVTLNPYLGKEALEPFLARKDNGCIILCKTSNPGASEFQDLIISKGKPLWQYVASQVVKRWNKNNNCALVAGATYPQELKKIRDIAGTMPLLIPGIGVQGGDIKATVKAGKDNHGTGMIINSSRGIIFASAGNNFANVARQETIKLRDSINKYL